MKMNHFSHKHPLTLIEDGKEPGIRCYGCMGKIGSVVPYYRCEEGCPLFCLHHACAHLPTTIKRRHSWTGCDVDVLQLKGLPEEYEESCCVCGKEWYSFAYVCSDCEYVVDIRCAMRGPNKAKHSFHQHPVYPCISPEGAEDLICSVCTLIITIWDEKRAACVYYKCNYCNFTVHPQCTNVPVEFESPSHPHKFLLALEYDGSQICKICQEKIDRNTQWAYSCLDCDEYYIHAGYEGCITSTSSTIRKDLLQHFDHPHLLALVDKQAPVAQKLYGHCCGQKILPSVPYYTCLQCKSYHLHQLCAHLPMEVHEHHLHPNCSLKLLKRRRSAICDACQQRSSGFFYKCSPCGFHIDIGCALRTQRTNVIFHKHPLFLSHTKAPFNCHACDRDTQGSSYQCISCQFWVHHQCASLPALKETSSHEHNLELVYTIPKKYSGVVVYCRICTKALKDNRWAYHCDQCRYLTHVYDCSYPYRKWDGVTIDPSEVVHLPLAGEPILEEKLTNGKMIKYHRHPMILFADQFESNAIDITPSFVNLIRGSTTWQTFNVDGKDYSGATFIFDNEILTMQATRVDLPRFVKHESHPHLLKSTFLNPSTWCHACEQTFFGLGFKCTTCAFTIDTYCALLPRMIKHRYDKHGFFSLTYSAVEGVEEYVCEICEKDVIPRYFYHCVACDQSIHARCIWHAYVQFDPNYQILRVRRLGFLVPPSQALPKCFICDQKKTFGHGFAFVAEKNNKRLLVHLTCLSEDDVQI